MNESLHVHDHVHGMASLVRSSFGPMGAEKLLFCPPEPPILTSSGYTILHYADMTKSHTAHPMKTYLMQKVRAVYSDMGDGVVQYLLLLDLVLQRIEPSRVWSATFAAAKTAIAPAFYATFDGLSIRTTVTFDSHTRQPSPSLVAATRAIVTTSLAGLFNSTSTAYLADLTVDWVFKSVIASINHALPATPAALYVYLEHILRHANDSLLSLPFAALDASRITRRHEYLLRLASHTNVTLRDEKLSSGQRIVLFVGSLEQLGSDASSVELQVLSAQSYLSSIQFCAQRVAEFLTALKVHHHVNLLLCTECTPDHVVASCRHLGIVCIPFVDKADMHALASRTGISWFTSVFEPINESLHVAINTAPLRCIRAGGARMIVPQVLLRAQSKGLCKQYYYAIKKGLRVLRFWCSSSAASSSMTTQNAHLQGACHCLTSLGGAQAAEVAFAHTLMQATSTTSTIPMEARVLLAQALVGVHNLLRDNLSATGALPQSTIHPLLMHRVDVSTCEGNHSFEQKPATSVDNEFKGVVLDVTAKIRTLAGQVDGCQVKEARPDDFGIVHPLNHCCRLLEHVLGTLEEVCRLDGHFLRAPKQTKTDDT
ncbi:hypothetical protein H310_01304 [Aphanomyces invadans]|uniref:Uncharacterized protein n=1 Tax=Aphanomyces invadans TaxID=157072 RepID=A0A024URI3_9STRA|nr:hypothetical protein H310_01304 [Aphanomyces invadans]ETW08790.1 hypothetical protein H310_01304 [Aphanomyces invadans]|eukprot:XP_008862595.1 hypothetical protein H310_01304 [Aphanomyces invadans]